MHLRTSPSTPGDTAFTDEHDYQRQRASWCCAAVEETASYMRHAVRATLARWGLDIVVDTAELCVSELVTNSIIHTKNPDSAIELDLALLGDRLRINVADANTSAPQPREPDNEEEHGRGLMLVRDMSTDWGVGYIAAGAGKTVWCELDVHMKPSR